jgi:hypothetical protein
MEGSAKFIDSISNLIATLDLFIEHNGIYAFLAICGIGYLFSMGLINRFILIRKRKSMKKRERRKPK